MCSRSDSLYAARGRGGEKKRRGVARWGERARAGRGRVFVTFHVALALEDDERVAAAAAVLVAHDSHPFDAAEALELPAQVVFGGAFMLRKSC